MPEIEQFWSAFVRWQAVIFIPAKVLGTVVVYVSTGVAKVTLCHCDPNMIVNTKLIQRAELGVIVVCSL